MDRKLTIGLCALLATAVLGAGVVMASPMGMGMFRADMTAEEIGAAYESQQAMTKAIENNDYESWKNLMEQRIEEMKSKLTQDNFDKIVEMHNAMKGSEETKQQIKTALENGDYETAKQLMDTVPDGARGFHMGGRGFI